MFTGLIEDIGMVREFRRGGERVSLTVATAIPGTDLTFGESIAVNGVCLTVTAINSGCFTVDVSPETLESSNLARLTAGKQVNLERALRLGDRLGGHLVSGHIDGIAIVTSRERDRNAVRFAFGCPARLSRYLVEKGSVAVDGVSLTVNRVGSEHFEVAVIPHSLEQTTLRECQPGSVVNLEVDVIGKYVERLLGPRHGGREGGGLDLETLAKHGFL